MFFFFVLRIVGGALDQKVIVGHEHGLRFPGADFFPLVFPQIAVRRELQFGRLRRRVNARLSLELGSDNAARGCSAGWKISRWQPSARS